MRLEDALAQCPVVAIVRGVRPDEVLDHAAALLEAGVVGVEVPLNSPDPIESIRRLSAEFGERMTTGAGTVLTPERVDDVAGAGGRIIVSPNTQPAVIRRAVELGLDPAPGFATASEAFTAIEAGARHLKLFPAATYGPGHVKQLKAVLPAEAVVWAVGGVGPDSMAEWWAAGARAFGLGGELYRAGQSVADTREKARRVVDAARKLG
ncbi:2-dehydro-3-deoxy-6-phosphogalactonate aldolase [Phenylobacterium sp.]|jgi:2-dehydro-3-deoxyphosphogalactonate aldolase|uniref:2-dehydro-3-deoxy-6-phosphogalactonate aldolase n=1 Tax=Phenylobacterium sp. TaxID=1871053 RepID=UPI002F948AD6